MTFIVPDPPRFADFRRHVDDIVAATVAAADADDAVSRYLRREGRFLTIGREPDAEQIDLDRGRVYLVASGKAAVPMARAALRVLGDDVAAGIVITKDTGLGADDLIQTAGEEFSGRPVKIFSAGHPVPDAAGHCGLAVCEAFMHLALE